MRSVNNLCNWTIGLMAGMLLMYACASTIDVGAEGETIGTRGGFRVKISPAEVKLEAAPPGQFLDVQARDAQGNPIGGPITGFGPGDTFPAVPGAASYTGTASTQTTCSSCTVDHLTTPSLRRLATPQLVGGGAQPFLLVIPARAFTASTAGYGPLSNTYATFGFNLSGAWVSANELWAKVAPILLAPIGTLPPVAGDTVVDVLIKAVPALNGPIDLYIADQTMGFESVTFKLNDQIIGTLGYHSETYVLENGWKLFRTRIIGSDIDGGGLETFDIIADTVEDDANGLVGRVTYQPQ